MPKPWPVDWRCRDVETTLVDDELLVLASFRDDPPNHYVIVSRLLVPGDEQRVHLERDDQIWAIYDGFTACRLWNDRIEFELTDEGQSKLVLPSRVFVIMMELSHDKMWELRRTMAVIFAGRNDYVDKMIRK